MNQQLPQKFSEQKFTSAHRFRKHRKRRAVFYFREKKLHGRYDRQNGTEEENSAETEVGNEFELGIAEIKMRQRKRHAHQPAAEQNQKAEKFLPRRLRKRIAGNPKDFFQKTHLPALFYFLRFSRKYFSSEMRG